ncbi:hypothetical protein BJ912DRAFT_1065855 [Pholiota molesta]|nr:hypothetical protein BJ912DRAFT_1065855 [Pholiota molesta]
MSLSSLPLPSISFVLTSNMLYVPTGPCVASRNQDPFPIPQVDPGHGIDQRDLETLEYQHLSYVLRGRLVSSKQKKWRWSVRWSNNTSQADTVPFFSKLLRKVVSTHGLSKDGQD